MALTIHGIAASRAIRPLWAATELALPFEHVPTPYQGGATRTAEFLALNPNGHIPVLVDERDGERIVVWESMACALYLTRIAGAPDGRSIAPATPREEAEALRWSFWALTELEKDALTVLMHRVAMPADQRKPDLADAAAKRLRGPLDVLEAQLLAQQRRGEAGLGADRFTIADLCVASVASWLRSAPDTLAQHPLTQTWLQACLQRPAHQQARKLG